MREVDEDEFNLDPAQWQAAALDEPLVITGKGRPKLYLLSKQVFDSLYAGSRRAVKASELDERTKKILRAAKMSPAHDHLDAELEEDNQE
jgi:PHD/YefM family antitoxin component YafN of YafNO toxin-antitoxin module